MVQKSRLTHFCNHSPPGRPASSGHFGALASTRPQRSGDAGAARKGAAVETVHLGKSENRSTLTLDSGSVYAYILPVASTSEHTHKPLSGAHAMSTLERLRMSLSTGAGEWPERVATAPSRRVRKVQARAALEAGFTAGMAMRATLGIVD